MEQQIIVYIIGIAVFLYIGYKFYLMLTGRAKKDPCSGCNGCDLKRELDAKKHGGCAERNTKSCCSK